MQQQLIDYVKSQLAKGYDIYTIRNHLVRYGYNPGEVDSAISKLHQTPQSHKVMIIAAGLGVIALIIFGAIILLMPKAPTQLLDIKISPISTSIFPGDSVKFNIEMNSLGAKKRYDVALKHEIISRKGGNIITFQEETVGIETSASKKSEVALPLDIEPGNYFLRTTAAYDGNKAIATFAFIVQQKIIEPKCPGSCDDSSLCTQDTCDESTNYTCAHINTVPCCGNGVCEEGETYDTCSRDCKEKPAEQPAPTPEQGPTNEINLMDELTRIKDISATNGDQAAIECSKLGEQDYIDVCLTEITKVTKNSAFCDGISDSTKKDACYVNLVIDNGDYSLCDKLANSYIKKSCESLAKLKSG